MIATASHRLLVAPERWARLRRLPAHPILDRCAAALDALADEWARDFTITVDETGHNYHLIRARHTQTRVVSLLVQYGRTGDLRFRDAALDYVRLIAGWEYWSWITWREGNAALDAIFDLSYGENSATLALAYDWLAAELTPDERALIVDTAQTRALRPYLARNGAPGEEMWYYRRKDCNWNTVCNGGAGMLALALGDACPESARVLELAEEGVRHYFEFLQEDGAWPEGIGYWGYGHRYGYWYLLSHERATGRPHSLLDRPGSRATLRFPLLFSPNNVPASFGDVNRYFPLPFHYAAAERYAMWDVVAELDRRMLRILEQDTAQFNTNGCWPGIAEMLLFHPGEMPGAECDWPTISIQKGLEWCYLADRWPQPRLYASVRGGATQAPHTHQDLLSVNVVVGDEALLQNVTVDDYLDSTFQGRRYEIFENMAASKNTLLVNGLGAPQPAEVVTTRVAGNGWEGVLLDATAVMTVGSPVRHCSRAVLLLEGQALLVLDRMALEHAGLFETRFHTDGRARMRGMTARVQGERESVHLAFASSVPAVLRLTRGLPTNPRREAETVLRWLSLGKVKEAAHATIITPAGSGRVRIDAGKGNLHVTGPGFAVTLHYATDGPGLA